MYGPKTYNRHFNEVILPLDETLYRRLLMNCRIIQRHFHIFIKSWMLSIIFRSRGYNVIIFFSPLELDCSFIINICYSIFFPQWCNRLKMKETRILKGQKLLLNKKNKIRTERSILFHRNDFQIEIILECIVQVDIQIRMILLLVRSADRRCDRRTDRQTDGQTDWQIH